MNKQPVPQRNKAWYSVLLSKPANPCENCTIESWGACHHAEYGKCKYADAKKRTPVLLVVFFLAAVIIASSCATTKDPFPFAPSYKYGRYPVKKYKPEKRKTAWINRQWGHEGR